MRARSFYSNLLFSLGLNLIIKPTAIFIIDAAVQNEVGSAYGLYFVFFNLSLILSILFDLGINNYSTRLSAQNIEVSKNYFSTVFVLRILLMLIYILGIVLLKYFVSISWTEYKLILLLGFNQFFIANISFFRSYFAGIQRFRLDAFFSVLDRLLLIFSMGYILYLLPDGHKLVSIESYALVQFGCYLLSFVIAFITAIFILKPSLTPIHLDRILPILKDAFPYALLIVLMTLYTRIDAWLLLHYSIEDGVREASNYAQAFRLIDALYMFAMVFAGILFPMFSKMLKENSNQIKGLVAQASKLLLGASFIFVVFSLFRGGIVIDLIYRESSADSALLLFLLSLAFLGMSSNLIYGSLLTANGSLKILNTISFVGLLLNFTLNLWLIPKAAHGAIAAAAIAAITQLFTAIAQAIYCKKVFQFEIIHKGLWRYLLLVLFSGAWYLSIYWAFGDFTPKSPLLAVLLILLDLCFLVVLLFLLKFIDLSELIKMLQVRSKTQ